MRMTQDQTRLATIASERAAVLAFARARGEAIDKMVIRGHLTEEQGSERKRAISLFADDIATGLHVPAVDMRAIRVAVRAAIGANNG